MKPIALSGFMAAGKSTVGRALAAATGRQFVDLDAEIEAAFARDVAGIFQEFGESAFRAMEARLLPQALSRADRVVALGGGVVCHPAARALLTARSHWVHLDVPLRELRRRVLASGGAASRPLWSDDQAARLLESRSAFYSEARVCVQAARPVAEVVAEVIAGLPTHSAAGTSGSDAGAPRRLSVQSPSGAYEIVIGRGLDDVIEHEVGALGRGPIALITDSNVGPLHGGRIAGLLGRSGRQVFRIELPAGEANKTIGPVLDAVACLLEAGWQRDAPVVVLGGGVPGDMAGLVASLTLRGVPLVQLPTSLLAMVDSSVGGKVGVNHRVGKNLVGAFLQPRLVVTDLAFLDTLPDRELRAGLGEVVKSALLGDLELLELLERRPDEVLARDPEVLAELVERCCRYKASVVALDALEAGPRRVLNLGHTLGHAIEAAAGYGALLHGEAVAVGLVGAAELAAARGIGPEELPGRIRRLLERLGLPVSVAGLPAADVTAAMAADKKLLGSYLAWVFLKEPGYPVIVEISIDELPGLMADLTRSAVMSPGGA
jgi:shikimate kinase / 3-dehydroquinate synthase